MNKKNQKKIVPPKPPVKRTRNLSEIIFSSDWAIVILLFLTLLLAYSNSFNVPFHFDDEQQIVLKDANHSFQNFHHLSYWLQINNRPVSLVTLVFNYVVNGEKVFWYHVINFIIHLLSGIFLFFFLKLIFNLSHEKQYPNWLPVVITLFFLVHPAQIQSVTYIVQRMTSLAGMFFILSIYLYTKGRILYLRDRKDTGAIILITCSFVVGLLGAFSKQSAIVFPLAMLLTELLFIRNAEGKICKRYVFSAVIVGFVGFIAVLLKAGLPYETNEISRVNYFATQMTVIPRYLQLMVVPVGLSIDHGVKAVATVFDLKVVGGALFLLGVLAFAFWQVKKRPLVSFGIFWFFIALLVESSILPIRDLMFDQRMYLPLAGFAISFWLLIYELFSLKKPSYLVPFVVLVLLSFSVGTMARNHLWQSNVAVWEKVTRMYPDYFRGWQGLGREYVASGEKDATKIVHCYEEALRIEPDNETVLNDLAANYLKTSDYVNAIKCSQKLENSSNPDFRLNAFRILAVAYLNSNQDDQALKYLEKNIQMKPDDISALQNIAGLYIRMKDYPKAIETAEKILKMTPDDVSSLLNIAFCQINLGKDDLAQRCIVKVLNNDSNNVRALVLNANVYAHAGKWDEALKNVQKAYGITNDASLLKDIERLEKMKEGTN